jgi:hypothetical protein
LQRDSSIGAAARPTVGIYRDAEALKKRGVGMVVGAPIKVYALHSGQRRIAGVRGDEGPSLKPDLNTSKTVPSTRIRTVAWGSLYLFD